MRFGDPRVQALAGALCTSVLAVTGITNKSLRALMTGLLGGATYTMNQASYDLARLRVNGLITRIPGKNRYRLTGDGLRFAIFYTKLHDRLLRPLLATDQPPAPPPLRKALAHHRHSHHRNHRPGPTATERSLKTQDNSQRSSDQGSLRRGRDFARQRWPFGQFHLTSAGGFVGWAGCPATSSACGIRIC